MLFSDWFFSISIHFLKNKNIFFWFMFKHVSRHLLKIFGFFKTSARAMYVCKFPFFKRKTELIIIFYWWIKKSSKSNKSIKTFSCTTFTSFFTRTSTAITVIYLYTTLYVTVRALCKCITIVQTHETYFDRKRESTAWCSLLNLNTSKIHVICDILMTYIFPFILHSIDIARTRIGGRKKKPDDGILDIKKDLESF